MNNLLVKTKQAKKFPAVFRQFKLHDITLFVHSYELYFSLVLFKALRETVSAKLCAGK